jgi:tetratricopeptide (TPR) repeat protein
MDPKNRDAWQYLGELRSAAASWKAAQRRAGQEDFERASEAFGRALEIDPGSQECQLALARLCLARADWEWSMRLDPGSSLARCKALLTGVMKARPGWPEAVVVQGGVHLQEAESSAPGERGQKAKESLLCFKQAFTVNPNLTREWEPLASRAEQIQQASLRPALGAVAKSRSLSK